MLSILSSNNISFVFFDFVVNVPTIITQKILNCQKKRSMQKKKKITKLFLNLYELVIFSILSFFIKLHYIFPNK
jgi:hypothetical protein